MDCQDPTDPTGLRVLRERTDLRALLDQLEPLARRELSVLWVQWAPRVLLDCPALPERKESKAFKGQRVLWVPRARRA
jgi:hypothetical protein